MFCDGAADCPEEADFGEATAADSLAVFFVVDVIARGVDVEVAVTDESAFAAGGRFSPFVQEQSRSTAGTRTLGRMQSCVEVREENAFKWPFTQKGRQT